MPRMEQQESSEQVILMAHNKQKKNSRAQFQSAIKNNNVSFIWSDGRMVVCARTSLTCVQLCNGPAPTSRLPKWIDDFITSWDNFNTLENNTQREQNYFTAWPNWKELRDAEGMVLFGDGTRSPPLTRSAIRCSVEFWNIYVCIPAQQSSKLRTKSRTTYDFYGFITFAMVLQR